MLFLESAPKALKDLQTGVVQNDAELVRQASHVLQSSSAAVGAVRLSARCKQLERMARSGSVLDVGRHVQAILRLYGAADSALRAWYASRACQTACKRDPGSASNRDPSRRWFRLVPVANGRAPRGAE